MNHSIRLMAAVAAIAVTTPAFASPDPVVARVTGGNNDIVNELADEFNKSQSDYKIVPTSRAPIPTR